MERNFFVLEDRVYADATLRRATRARPLRELAPGHVIYVNSLSKVVGGGLRAGWVAARGPVRERIAMLKLESDFHSATLIQHIAARWLATGAYDRHVEQTQPFYRERRDALLAALERHMPGEYQADPPQGGHHVWVTLTRPLDERALYTEAARHGVAIIPGDARHRRAPDADLLPAVVLAARPARARRGRAGGWLARSARCAAARGTPSPRRCRSARASATARRAFAARRGRSGSGTACGPRRGASSAPSRTRAGPRR